MIKTINKEFIFEENEITPSCHASTVLPLENGEVLAAWFGGKKEGSSDVEIYLSKRNTAGEWSRPEIVSENDSVPHWNPVLHRRLSGEIILYYKYGSKPSAWITKYVCSEDGGKSWSKPATLVENDFSGGRGPVKNKCLRLTNSVLLAPASTESNGQWLPFIDISSDDGLTWVKSKKINRAKYFGFNVGLIQPTLWEDKDKTVHALMRSDKGAVYSSISTDSGTTWSKPLRTRLPNNNSGIDCVKDDKERIWLLYNPVRKNWGERYPLSLAVSLNNGKTFNEVFSPEKEKGEFSYPAITYMDGKLYATYTYNRKKIAFLEIAVG